MFSGTVYTLHRAMWKILDRSHNNIHTIAYVLGVVSILGYLAAFLRDRAFAHYFGTTDLLDVYVASFRIPDTLFIVATAFISVYALLPFFEEKKRKGKKELQEFIDTTFYFLLLFLIGGSVVLFFATPAIAKSLFSSFSGQSQETFILFSRVFLIQASLFAVSSFFTAILQHKRKFLLYSLLPLFYNIGILLGVMVLYPKYGAVGLALGVLVGVLLNVLVQVPIMLRNNIIPKIAPTRRAVVECWRAVKLSVPRASALLSHSVTQVFIFSFIISISEGALSVYYFADNLKAIPLVVIGAAYSVAAFPMLVTYFAENDLHSFRTTIENAIRRLLFFILPLIACIFVLREPLISLFFETGSFTAENTAVTGTILGVFIFSALTTSVRIICARAMYAYGKSFAPFAVLSTLAVLQVIAVFFTVKFLQGESKILAIIQHVAELPSSEYGTLFAVIVVMVTLEIVASIIILVMLSTMIGQKLIPIAKAFLQNTAAGIILISIIAAMKNNLFADMVYSSSLTGLLAIILMVIAGGIGWYATLYLVGNKERHLLKKRLLRMLKSPWRT